MNLLHLLRRTPPAPEADTEQIVYRYDRGLLAITLVLIGFGLVMVYSASIFMAENQAGDPTHFFKRQLFALGPGVVAMVALANLHHEVLRRLAPWLVAAAIVLLVVVLVPGVSTSAKGASRWLPLGPFHFQPSELAKLALVVWLSSHLSRETLDLSRWRLVWLPALVVTAVVAALLIQQPDLGSVVICGGMMLLLIWTAGARHLHTFLPVVAGSGLLAVAIVLEPYRLRRLTAFLSPEKDPLGAAYQINQALISFGSGELTGLGLGESRQKLLYLPDAHTDFIFSIIGEELGFVGVASVVLVFLLFVWRGMRVARKASSPFGALLAFGLTAQIGVQAVVNMAVVTALLPTKGLTLPFISYGGSSMLISCAMVGILLNISRGEPPPAWLHATQGQKAKRKRKRSAAVAVTAGSS